MLRLNPRPWFPAFAWMTGFRGDDGAFVGMTALRQTHPDPSRGYIRGLRVLSEPLADLANALVPPGEIVILADLRGELDLIQRGDRGILGRGRRFRAQYGGGGKRVNFVIRCGQHTNARLADAYLDRGY